MSDITTGMLGILIKCRDIKASRAFYDALGFEKWFDYGPGLTVQTYEGSFYKVNDTSVIELCEAHEAVHPDVFRTMIADSKVSVFVKVDSLVRYIRVCESSGIPIRTPPRSFAWKTIEMVIYDPDGLRIVFVSDDSETEHAHVQALTSIPLERAQPNYAPTLDRSAD